MCSNSISWWIISLITVDPPSCSHDTVMICVYRTHPFSTSLLRFWISSLRALIVSLALFCSHHTEITRSKVHTYDIRSV
jgi:hypothetical protein